MPFRLLIFRCVFVGDFVNDNVENVLPADLAWICNRGADISAFIRCENYRLTDTVHFKNDDKQNNKNENWRTD